jgi:Tfp pilus assembly protein FimT
MLLGKINSMQQTKRIKTQGWKRRRNAGYTMMEAALTVSVVLILMAFGIPSLFGAVDTFRLNSAVDAATWGIQGARYQAIMKGYPYQIAFATATNTYQLSSKIPPAATFSNVGGAIPLSGSAITISAATTLQFKANGSVSEIAGNGNVPINFQITYKGRTKTITVSNYGSITVQ